jgi:hypothetical protein
MWIDSAVTEPIATHGWLGNNWGSLVSIVGLVVTLFTLRSATKASKAAEEAKSYILVRTMSQDLDQANLLSQDIYNSLKNSNSEAAGIRCRDLNDLVGRFSARWSAHLTEDSRNNFLRAKDKLTGLEKGFEKTTETSDGDNNSVRLLRISRELTKIFLEEKAKLERTLDSHGE